MYLFLLPFFVPFFYPSFSFLRATFYCLSVTFRSFLLPIVPSLPCHFLLPVHYSLFLSFTSLSLFKRLLLLPARYFLSLSFTCLSLVYMPFLLPVHYSLSHSFTYRSLFNMPHSFAFSITLYPFLLLIFLFLTRLFLFLVRYSLFLSFSVYIVYILRPPSSFPLFIPFFLTFYIIYILRPASSFPLLYYSFYQVPFSRPRPRHSLLQSLILVCWPRFSSLFSVSIRINLPMLLMGGWALT